MTLPALFTPNGSGRARVQLQSIDRYGNGDRYLYLQWRSSAGPRRVFLGIRHDPKRRIRPWPELVPRGCTRCESLAVSILQTLKRLSSERPARRRRRGAGQAGRPGRPQE